MKGADGGIARNFTVSVVSSARHATIIPHATPGIAMRIPPVAPNHTCDWCEKPVSVLVLARVFRLGCWICEPCTGLGIAITVTPNKIVDIVVLAP